MTTSFAWDNIKCVKNVLTKKIHLLFLWLCSMNTETPSYKMCWGQLYISSLKIPFLLDTCFLSRGKLSNQDKNLRTSYLTVSLGLGYLMYLWTSWHFRVFKGDNSRYSFFISKHNIGVLYFKRFCCCYRKLRCLI